MLSDADALTGLAAALSDLARWLRDEKISGVVIGGVAASVLGKPRLTRDVDALILGDEMGWENVIASAVGYGISPRANDTIGFATRTRVLLLRHDPSGVDIDISLAALPFEREVIARSVVVAVGVLRVQLATPEDVIIMKALARRPRDIADIEGILDVQRELDFERIRDWLRQFSSILEMPEIHDEFERLLRMRGSRH